MDLIYQNPFRILGIPVTATDREIAKQIGDMAIYADMGKPIEFDSDNFFSVKPKRSVEHIQEAKQKIEQPNNKLFHSLFWFWENSNNTIDEMAFEELKNGNIDKAIEFWERETENGITAKNISNHKNLSVLLLGLATITDNLDKNHFLKSLALSGEFLANGHFDDFTKLIVGYKHSVDLLEITNLYVDEIILMVKPHISKRESSHNITHKELLTHFETYPDTIQNDIIEKLIGKHIHNIERQIEITESLRQDYVSIADTAGFDLYNNTKEDIVQLQLVLSKSNLKFQLIADKLAEEILQCSIDYFNEYYDSSPDPGDDALKLLKYAKKIAVGDKIKDRITDNQPNIEEFVADKQNREKLLPVKAEFDYIYDKLEMFQRKIASVSNANSLLNDCESKLFSIKDKLSSIDENYINISTIVVSNVFSMLISCFNEAIEKRNKYVEWENKKYLNLHIPNYDDYFDQFGLGNRNIKPEYYSFTNLENVVKDVWGTSKRLQKFAMSNKQRTHFNENKDTIKSVCKKLGISTFEGFSIGGSGGDNGCYIATMVYGSYDAPEVLDLRDFRDQVLLKNKLGKIFVKTYYKYSPGLVELTKDIKIIHKMFRRILNGIITLIEGK